MKKQNWLDADVFSWWRPSTWGWAPTHTYQQYSWSRANEEQLCAVFEKENSDGSTAWAMQAIRSQHLGIVCVTWRASQSLIPMPFEFINVKGKTGRNFNAFLNLFLFFIFSHPFCIAWCHGHTLSPPLQFFLRFWCQQSCFSNITFSRT